MYQKENHITINTVPLGISLTNVYAPHAGLTSQTKTDFYDSLAHLVRQQPPHQINLILGDFNFNARLMEILPGERMILGQFIYRDPESAISNLSSGQIENRNHRPLFRRNIYRQILGSANRRLDWLHTVTPLCQLLMYQT